MLFSRTHFQWYLAYAFYVIGKTILMIKLYQTWGFISDG